MSTTTPVNARIPTDGVLVHWCSQHGEWAWREFARGVPVNGGLLTKQEDEPDGYGDVLDDVASTDGDLLALARERLEIGPDTDVVVTDEDIDL